MNLEKLLALGKTRLQNAGILDYECDAWLLLSYVTGVSRAYYYAHPDQMVSDADRAEYLELLEKRMRHIPLQQITHQAFFMGYEFYADEHVLIPRQDTETLVLACLEVLSGKRSPRILDMCTGSGCILISLLLERPDARGVGADISVEALEVARKNAEKLGTAERSSFIESDLFSAAFFDKKECHGSQKYDILVSNPPYIRTGDIRTLMEEVKDHDPEIALDGGNDGLDFYRRITAEAPFYLNPGGALLFETGYDQGEPVCELMRKAGFSEIRTIKDLSGLCRVAAGKLST